MLFALDSLQLEKTVEFDQHISANVAAIVTEVARLVFHLSGSVCAEFVC